MRAGKGGIAGLAAFVVGIVERAADGVVDRKVIFRDDGARIRQRRRIRHRRSRRDRGRIVVRHVRYRQRHDLGALAGARQPAALDPRQMLANGVDLADRRARAQQRPGHLLLLRERHAVDRRDPVRRAAARQQHQQQIVGLGVCSQLQAVLGALQPGFVGHGMAGLDHLDPPRRHAMAVAGGGDARQPRRLEPELVEIMPLGGGGHRGRALAGGKADHPAFRHRAQMRRQHDVGMRGGNGGIEDRAQQRASVGHRFTAISRWGTCGCRLSIRLPAKENPRSELRGSCS